MIPSVLVPGPRLDVLWLDQNFAMNYSTLDQLQIWPTGTSVDLGGRFAAPPAGVSVGADQLHVFGLSSDYTLHRNVYNATAGDVNWSGWRSLGGNFASAPAAVSTASNRVDLFCVSQDNEMMHTAWDGTVFSPWEFLGGGFTSLPVPVVGSDGTIHIFARGLDFLLYHMAWQPNTAVTWKILGGGLLGEPKAASAPAAVRVRGNLFVFVTGTDGAIWYTAFDSKVWKPWVSLGPTQKATKLEPNLRTAKFVTEPVAVGITSRSSPVSQPPQATPGGPTLLAGPPPPMLAAGDEIDVFAVGADYMGNEALWHKWIDQAGVHGQTEWDAQSGTHVETGNWKLVGGNYAAAPSIIGAARPGTVISGDNAQFTILNPNPDATVHLFVATKDSATQFDAGPSYGVPSRYKVSIDKIFVGNPRSLISDSDLGALTLQVGSWPTRAVSDTVLIYEASKNETYPISVLQFPPIIMDLCEPVAFSYTVVNSGNSDIATSIISTITKGTEDFLNDLFKALTNPSSNILVQGVGEVLTDAGGGPVLIGSIVGSATALLIDPILGTLLGLFLGDVFADCDGVVASEVVAYRKTRDIQAAMYASGQQTISTATRHDGTDSHSGCGANSVYTVYWSITAA